MPRSARRRSVNAETAKKKHVECQSVLDSLVVKKQGIDATLSEIKMHIGSTESAGTTSNNIYQVKLKKVAEMLQGGIPAESSPERKQLYDVVFGRGGGERSPPPTSRVARPLLAPSQEPAELSPDGGRAVRPRLGEDARTTPY